MDEIKAQFETNFFGAVRVMQEVIPVIRKQRSGRIVNITSVGGRIEPGAVGSNLLKNLKMAAKTSDPTKSLYRPIESSMSEAFKQWSQDTIHQSEVAKVILQTVVIQTCSRKRKKRCH
jgi:NAD(P)-dependent dehydrogenase (short-subunit alcohol dehydrogenase family)